MAFHGFQIMEHPPLPGQRYDGLLSDGGAILQVDDNLLEPLLCRMDGLDVYWHSLDMPGQGLAYCGITLIPPAAVAGMEDVVKDAVGMSALAALLERARQEGRFVIHYGL